MGKPARLTKLETKLLHALQKLAVETEPDTLIQRALRDAQKRKRSKKFQEALTKWSI